MTVRVEEIRNILEKADTMADMDTLANEVPLTEQGVDSLDSANIYLLLEEKYEIKIPDGDMGQLDSINNIVTYLNKKVM